MRLKVYLIVLVMVALSTLTQCSADKTESTSTAEYNQEAAALYYQAQQNYNNQKYINSIALIDSAVKAGGIKAELQFLKGLSLLKINQFEPAINEFRQALELNPEFYGANYQLGHTHSLLEEYNQALEYYFKELDKVKSGVDSEKSIHEKSVLLQIGRTYNQLSLLDSAEIYYQKAISLDSNFALAYGDMADIYKKSGEFNKALQLYHKAMTLIPNDPVYLYNYGSILFQMGKTEHSIQYLRETVEKFPWHHGAHNMLGRALMTLGNEEKAAYHINRADTLQDIGYDIAMYKLNTKTFPGDVQRWLELGDAYRSVGRYREAMNTFKIAENLQPSNLNILNRMANVSYEMKNPVQAIRLYRRILELKPDEPKIWYNLGMAYMMEGNLDRARWAFELALHYDPDFDPAKVYLSRL